MKCVLCNRIIRFHLLSPHNNSIAFLSHFKFKLHSTIEWNETTNCVVKWKSMSVVAVNILSMLWYTSVSSFQWHFLNFRQISASLERTKEFHRVMMIENAFNLEALNRRCDRSFNTYVELWPLNMLIICFRCTSLRKSSGLLFWTYELCLVIHARTTHHD